MIGEVDIQNEINRIGYFAVIPATVLFNNELKPNEKLLYALITALSNKEGYCYASNKYLGEKLGVDHKTVSRWIAIFEREKGNVFGMQSDGKSQPHPAPAESDVKALQSRIKELEKRLRMAEIKAEAYDEMINVAEAKFKIPIRKKAGAKR